jgi:mono/diheme cytochrome c family protein
MNLRIAILLVSAIGAHAAAIAADSERGAKLFGELACVQCHSVNGKGAQVGPDLGRLADRNFTPATLAATMWNHAPTMWASMHEKGVKPGELDEQAARDLFAYFYSARFFEKPGDAGRGKQVFTERNCAKCHGLTEAIPGGAPPVGQWQTLNSPFALAEAMWNHLPRMRAVAETKRTALPQLEAQDLVDLLVYLRNFPGLRGQPQGGFQTTSGTNGEALFQSKGCANCHKAGSALANRIKGDTLTEIAAAMWNHAPKMAAAGAPAVVFAPGEMRELLSYLWAKQFFESAGDAARGKRVFSAKHCATCHDDAGSGAPKLQGAGTSFSAAAMVAALWHHGPTMLESMRAKQIAWPRFDTSEMPDLIAYLNSQEHK